MLCPFFLFLFCWIYFFDRRLARLTPLYSTVWMGEDIAHALYSRNVSTGKWLHKPSLIRRQVSLTIIAEEWAQPTTTNKNNSYHAQEGHHQFENIPPSSPESGSGRFVRQQSARGRSLCLTLCCLGPETVLPCHFCPGTSSPLKLTKNKYKWNWPPTNANLLIHNACTCLTGVQKDALSFFGDFFLWLETCKPASLGDHPCFNRRLLFSKIVPWPRFVSLLRSLCFEF